MPNKNERKLLIDNPTLMQEWNYERNVSLNPSDFTAHSGKKVWWKCDKGHEWQARISHRINGTGCPYCAGKKAIKGENDLLTVNPVLAQEWNYEKNGDLNPTDVMPNSGKKVWWKCNKCGNEWQATVDKRTNGRGCPICKSESHTSFPEYAICYYLKKCGIDIIHGYKEKGYELDIYIPSKNVAIEYDGYFWHKNKEKRDLEKNEKCKKDGINLYRIREGLTSLNDYSIDYIIQEDQKGLEETIQKIIKQITDIVIDVNFDRDNIEIENLREYTEKENSLLISNPNLAKEWNYEKNGKLKPSGVTANSNKKAWWKCSKGHEWQATISNRVQGKGCPICSGHKVLKGYNDLETRNPKLAQEWNYEKNGNLKPYDFTANSNKKVWWKCSKGHEYQATIDNRTQGKGCPICAGQKVLKGYNDLETVNPKLANEWNYEKNGNLKPSEFTIGSHFKAWWKCSKGHEWQAVIKSRTKGSCCPYCSGHNVLKGYNDLETKNPKLAKEWNYEKNGNLMPSDVTTGCGKKVWWKCNKCGNEWQATVDKRTNGRGCPYCAGKMKDKKD